MPAIPRDRPKLDHDVVRQVLWRTNTADPNVDTSRLIADCPVQVLAIRGYYRDSIGRPERNDFGVWDDAAFLVDLKGGEVHPFNVNTDPVAAGHNARNGGKLFAQLVPGIWPMRRGPHKGVPNHFRQLDEGDAVKFDLDRYFLDQRARGRFAVRRLVTESDYRVEWGYQAINLHAGSKNGTSSWGCTTFPPDQWPAFQTLAYGLMDEHGQQVLPYVLTE